MNGNPEEVKKPTGWGARHTLAILGFWAFGISYAMRFNLSLAIVAMVKRHDGSATSSSKPVIESCSELREVNAYLVGNDTSLVSTTTGEFEWTEAEQGFILGSFFFGYVLTQMPGGILSAKFGGKWPLGLGLFITAVFALITPIAARTHTYFLVLVRVIQGLGEGLTTPAMHAILAQWAPPNERSVLGSIVYAGAQFGTATTMIIGGYLIHGNVLGGWPSVFYFFGAVSLIWFVLWTFFMYDTPASHPRISAEELAYIETSIGKKSSSKIPTPWRQIFTSRAVWAIVIGHSGHVWGLYTLLTLLPTYLRTVLHFDIKQNGWLSAFPYIIMWIVSIFSTQLADLLVTKKIMRIVWVRKICHTISQVGPAAALVGAAYSGCDRIAAMALLTTAVGINGIVYGGYVVNHVDISPNHAGVLMGITNTVANLCGFAAPYVAGLLINQNPTIERWRYVFFLSASIYCVAALIFAIFASGTQQPWNDLSDSEDNPAPVKTRKRDSQAVLTEN